MLENILNIENVERKVFNRHFLKGVILEVAFSSDIRKYFKDKNYKDVFKNKGYTKYTEINNIDFKITIIDDKPSSKQTNDTIGYSYINPETNNEIQIINNRIIFIQKTYIKFNTFTEEIVYFANNIFDKIVEKINKIGYRKINSIVVGDMESYSDITTLFNENLFGFLRTNLFNYDLLENYRDNLTLKKNNTKYIINTTCSKIQNINNSYEVNVDNDIILNEEIDMNNLLDCISSINQAHFNLFCWVTSDKMKTIMDEE